MHGMEISSQDQPNLPESERILLIIQLRFPNPAKANFNIDLSDLKSTASIKIINSTGQVIQQLESEPNNAFKTITTIGWSSGLYVIEVSTKDGVFINKILIENQ